MSRSRRKTPISGVTIAESEKQDKRIANRKLRRLITVAVQTDAEVLPVIDDVSDPWGMPKEGKVYRGSKVDVKAMRK